MHVDMSCARWMYITSHFVCSQDGTSSYALVGSSSSDKLFTQDELMSKLSMCHDVDFDCTTACQSMESIVSLRH